MRLVTCCAPLQDGLLAERMATAAQQAGSPPLSHTALALTNAPHDGTFGGLPAPTVALPTRRARRLREARALGWANWGRPAIPHRLLLRALEHRRRPCLGGSPETALFRNRFSPVDRKNSSPTRLHERGKTRNPGTTLVLPRFLQDLVRPGSMGGKTQNT